MSVGHTSWTVRNIWVSVFKLFNSVLQMGLYHHVLMKFLLQLIWSDSYPPLEGGICSPVPLVPFLSLQLALMLVTCVSKLIRLVFLSWWIWLVQQSIWCFYTYSDWGEQVSLLLWWAVKMNLAMIYNIIPSKSWNGGSMSKQQDEWTWLHLLCVFEES